MSLCWKTCLKSLKYFLRLKETISFLPLVCSRVLLKGFSTCRYRSSPLPLPVYPNVCHCWKKKEKKESCFNSFAVLGDFSPRLLLSLDQSMSFSLSFLSVSEDGKQMWSSVYMFPSCSNSYGNSIGCLRGKKIQIS